MSDQKTQQPTILIKKADGTSVRVSLDEFRKMKYASIAAASQVPPPQDEVSHETPMVVEEPEVPATTTPVGDAFLNAAASFVHEAEEERRDVVKKVPEESVVAEDEVSYEKDVVGEVSERAEENQLELSSEKSFWTPEDHVSPLEENMQPEEVRTEPQTITSATKLDTVEDIIASLPFQIPTGILGRTKALIQSRLKEVRSDEQVIRYATQPEIEGGLGLSGNDASVLIERIHEALGMKQQQPKYQSVQEELMNKKTRNTVTKPVKVEMNTPAPVSVEQTRKTSPSSSPLDTLIRQEVGEPDILAMYKTTGESNHPATSVRSGTPTVSAQKPIIHDVTPPSAEVLGPIDELRRFTLTDLRRLGGTMEQRKMILRTKFDTLKRDSFVLFMQGRDAWYQSPLYRQYVSLIVQALNQRTALAGILTAGGEEEKITPEEFDLMVEIGGQLRT